jgi:hypothetical protein
MENENGMKKRRKDSIQEKFLKIKWAARFRIDLNCAISWLRVTIQRQERGRLRSFGVGGSGRGR